MAASQVNRNGANVVSPDWSIQAVKQMVFNAKTGTGAVGTGTLFTVTGSVLMRLFGKVVTAPGATSASVSPSASASASISSSVSPSASASSSESRSVSPSASTSPSSSASFSPSSSLSPSSSASSSASPSLSPSSSLSPSASLSPSSSSSASLSPSASISPSASLSPSSSSSASPSAGTTGEIAVGTATNPTGLIATTDASALVANRFWADATPTTTVEPVASLAQFIVTEDVIQTITTEAFGAGAVDYYCIWYPLSPDSSVVAA